MFCPDCGAQIPEGGTVCPNCGKDLSSLVSQVAAPAAPVPEPVGETQLIPEQPTTYIAAGATELLNEVPSAIPAADATVAQPVVQSIPVDPTTAMPQAVPAPGAYAPQQPQYTPQPTYQPQDYAQQQYAQPQYSQQQYAQPQPDYGYQQPTYTQQPPQQGYVPQAPAPAPKKDSGLGKIIIAVVGLLIAAAAGFFAFRSCSKPDTPEPTPAPTANTPSSPESPETPEINLNDFVDGHGNITVSGLLELDGNDFCDLLEQNGYEYISNEECYLRRSDMAALGAVDNTGTLLAESELRRLGAGARGERVAFINSVGGYSSARAAFDGALKCDVLDAEFYEDALTALIADSSGNEYFILVLAHGDGTYDFLVYNDATVAAGMLDDRLGGSYGSSPREAWINWADNPAIGSSGTTTVPTPATAGRDMYVGVWEISYMESDGETLTAEDLDMMKEVGLTVYLIINNDGSAQIDMFGEIADFEWTFNNDTAYLVFPNGNVPIEFTEVGAGRVTLKEDDTLMTFDKIDPADRIDMSDVDLSELGIDVDVEDVTS